MCYRFKSIGCHIGSTRIHKKNHKKSRLKETIARGKEQGYLTYAEVNDHLPADITDPEQIEEIISMINEMGIPCSRRRPRWKNYCCTENEAAKMKSRPKKSQMPWPCR